MAETKKKTGTSAAKKKAPAKKTAAAKKTTVKKTSSKKKTERGPLEKKVRRLARKLHIKSSTVDRIKDFFIES